MKITKICAILLISLTLILLSQGECISQYNQQDNPVEKSHKEIDTYKLIEEADVFFNEEEYGKAEKVYKKAYLILKETLKQEEERSVVSRKDKLEKKKNIVELRRKLRQLGILKKRSKSKKGTKKRKRK